MPIKPSTAIRNDYRKEEERRHIQIEEMLCRIEDDKKNGTAQYIPMKEAFSEIDNIIDKVEAASL